VTQTHPRPKVLLVEDDREMRVLMARDLRHDGYTLEQLVS
jgi:CheY-like chemotaxis protein